MHEDPEQHGHNMWQVHPELRAQRCGNVLHQQDDGVLHGALHCPELLHTAQHITQLCTVQNTCKVHNTSHNSAPSRTPAHHTSHNSAPSRTPAHHTSHNSAPSRTPAHHTTHHTTLHRPRLLHTAQHITLHHLELQHNTSYNSAPSSTTAHRTTLHRPEL